MNSPKPSGLSWSEQGSVVRVRPHWGHSLVAFIMLVVNVGVVTFFGMNPQPGKHIPWLWIGPVFLAMVAWLFYPYWGRTNISFDAQLFRIGRETYRVAELVQFYAEPTDSGYALFLVKVNGERSQLSLPFGNPLFAHGSGASRRTKELQRNNFRAEAEWAAWRLNELLTESRRGNAGYRG